jgi:hypothetical protein
MTAEFYPLQGRKLRLNNDQRRRLAERFVRSIKEECLGRMIFFGERSLRRAIREHAEHYQLERPHRGIGRHREPSSTASSALVAF